MDGAAGRLNASQAGVTRVRTALEGIVKLRLTAVSDAQHGGFTAGSSRARAFQSMVGGGMDVSKAAALAGLMDGD